jgi:hypothetical protein
MSSSLFASVGVIEFQTTECIQAQNGKYNTYIHPRDEKVKVMLWSTPNLMIKFIDDMVVEINFRIKKYSQVFNMVRTGYRELTNFILIDHYVREFLEKDITLVLQTVNLI